MPRLWNATIEAHRRDVRDAVLDTTAALIAEQGLLSVTMSRIAEETGIGRATLYKYFPDVEAILVAWHERQMTAHLKDLAEVRDRTGDATHNLHAVLEAYALMTNESAKHHNTEIATLIHRHEHVTQAEHDLHHLVQDLLSDAAKSGAIRADVPADELATYCLNALAAAASLPSKTAVRRLVAVILSGLHRPE
ncbi:MAG: helix-turn-helix domain-containing protein [Thermoleophilia bacterium]